MSWRKSWPKLNIYGKDGDGNCDKRKLLPDERSVWDDYLDLAHLSPVRGSVCIASNIGYTAQQLSQILNTTEELIVRAEARMVELGMISIINREITIKNWQKYQSEYERQSQYRVTSKGYKKELQEKVTERIEENRREENNNTNNKECPSSKYDFSVLWAKYPEKVGRREAERHFIASVKSDRDYVDIQTALENYLQSERVRRGFIQNGKTWFNDWQGWVNKKPDNLSKWIVKT